jgi:hypothetical protein
LGDYWKTEYSVEPFVAVILNQGSSVRVSPVPIQ